MPPSRFVLVLCAVIMAASSARAILPPGQYESLQNEADHVLQIRVDDVSLPSAPPNRVCTVRGIVVSLFRKPTGDSLAMGDPIRFNVRCRNETDSDESTGPHIIYTRTELIEEPFMEVYLNRTNTGFALADYGMGIMLLPHPTATPGGDL